MAHDDFNRELERKDRLKNLVVLCINCTDITKQQITQVQEILGTDIEIEIVQLPSYEDAIKGLPDNPV